MKWGLIYSAVNLYFVAGEADVTTHTTDVRISLTFESAWTRNTQTFVTDSIVRWTICLLVEWLEKC